MKYIKTYEDMGNKFQEPNFKVGDSVICIRSSSFTDLNQKYIIDDIFQENGVYFCRLKGILRDNVIPVRFYCARFMSEIDYVGNKYNL